MLEVGGVGLLWYVAIDIKEQKINLEIYHSPNH
jgi:hypothetical protein